MSEMMKYTMMIMISLQNGDIGSWYMILRRLISSKRSTNSTKNVEYSILVTLELIHILWIDFNKMITSWKRHFQLYTYRWSYDIHYLSLFRKVLFNYKIKLLNVWNRFLMQFLYWYELRFIDIPIPKYHKIS